MGRSLEKPQTARDCNTTIQVSRYICIHTTTAIGVFAAEPKSHSALKKNWECYQIIPEERRNTTGGKIARSEEGNFSFVTRPHRIGTDLRETTQQQQTIQEKGEEERERGKRGRKKTKRQQAGKRKQSMSASQAERKRGERIAIEVNRC